MATKLKSGYSWKTVSGKMRQVKNGAAISPGFAGKSTGADIGGTTNKAKSAAANAARVGAGGAPKTGMNKTPGRTAANRKAALNKAKPSLRTKIAGAIGGVVGKVDTKAKRKAALNKAKTNLKNAVGKVDTKDKRKAVFNKTKASIFASAKNAVGKVDTKAKRKAALKAALNKAKTNLNKAKTSISASAKNAVGKVDTKYKRKYILNKAKNSIFASAKNAVNSAKGAGSRSSKQIAAAKENILKAVAASALARKGKKLVRGRGVTGIRAGIRNAVITARSKGRGGYSRGFVLPKRKLRKVSTIRSYAPGKAVNTSA